jgi:hypothetical protein
VKEVPRGAHRKGIRLGFLLHDGGERLPIKIANKIPSRGRKDEKKEGRRSSTRQLPQGRNLPPPPVAAPQPPPLSLRYAARLLLLLPYPLLGSLNFLIRCNPTGTNRIESNPIRA